jgi:hypothetical protein
MILLRKEEVEEENRQRLEDEEKKNGRSRSKTILGTSTETVNSTVTKELSKHRYSVASAFSD